MSYALKQPMHVMHSQAKSIVFNTNIERAQFHRNKNEMTPVIYRAEWLPLFGFWRAGIISARLSSKSNVSLSSVSDIFIPAEHPTKLNWNQEHSVRIRGKKWWNWFHSFSYLKPQSLISHTLRNHNILLNIDKWCR